MSSPTKSCQRCSALFTCVPENILSCQCQVPLDSKTSAFLTKTKYDCLCASCLLQLDQLVRSASQYENIHNTVFEEGLHYYIEGDKWVFTEYYHMIRGYCCQSGCRHCAYGFK